MDDLDPQFFSSLQKWIIKKKEYSIENAIDGTYADVENIVEKANFLRKQIFEHAINFLIKCNCYGIIKEIEKELNVHDDGKTWVYSHLDELEADLNTPRNIELNRSISCTAENITNCTDMLFPLLDSIDSALRFCADETMLQPSVRNKVLIPKDMQRPLEPNEITLPHITGR